MKNQSVIDTFEIPDELAKELSELLVKQSIRERMLLQLVDDQDKYELAEKSLIPIVAKVDAIKVKITKEYVPEKYRSNQYIWNYNSYEVDKNKVEIISDI